MNTVDRPAMSVVMTVVDGEAALVRALVALREQSAAPQLEVIVPFDDTISGIAHLAQRFPEVRFVDLGTLHPAGTALNSYTQHAIYDRRRAGGLRAANGRLVAMLEDRGLPRADWARAMVALHEEGATQRSGARSRTARAAALGTVISVLRAAARRSRAEATDISLCYRRDALKPCVRLEDATSVASELDVARSRHQLRFPTAPSSFWNARRSVSVRNQGAHQLGSDLRRGPQPRASRLGALVGCGIAHHSSGVVRPSPATAEGAT
jgi:hypothetical protein